MNYANILKYTSQFYPIEEAKLLQDIAFENSKDMDAMVRSIIHDNEKPNEPDIKKIRKNLKAKIKKFVISKNFNIGNLYSFGANIEETNIQRLFLIPMGDYTDDYNARITFRYYKKSKIMAMLFNKLIMSLKSSKVRFETDIIKGKINFTVLNPLDNEKFWAIINIWSKN